MPTNAVASSSSSRPTSFPTLSKFSNPNPSEPHIFNPNPLNPPSPSSSSSTSSAKKRKRTKRKSGSLKGKGKMDEGGGKEGEFIRKLRRVSSLGKGLNGSGEESEEEL